MIRVNNMIYIMAASYLRRKNLYQFRGGNNKVVLLFQLAAENIVCCGNPNINL